MSRGKRHRFHGSRIAMFTGWEADSPPRAVVAISRTNPAVASMPAHGLEAGTPIRLSGIVGMTELNDEVVVVINPTPDAFELAGVNAEEYGAYVSGGAVEVAQMSQFCELTNFQRQGGSRPETSVSSLCSEAEEVELGLLSAGSVSISANYAPDVRVQESLVRGELIGDTFPIQYLPKGAKTLTTLLGYVQQTTEGAQAGGVWTASYTYRISGLPVRVKVI